MIRQKTIDILEFPKIRERLAKFCVNEDAKSAAAALSPSFDFAAISEGLNRTEEADILLNKYITDPVAGYDKLGNILEKAAVQSVLNLAEILKVSRLLKASRVLSDAVFALDAPEIVLLRHLCGGIFKMWVSSARSSAAS